MSGKYAELTVLVPVSQYVRVEAAAAEGKRSLESTASFLLSEWVLTTQGCSAKPSLAVRAAAEKGSGCGGIAADAQDGATRGGKPRHSGRGTGHGRGEA